MRIQGHVAGGYLVTQALLAWLKPPSSEEKQLLVLGTLAGVLPDGDTLLHLARTRSLEFGEDFDHHAWITHTFPFYLLPGLGLFLYGQWRNRPKIRRGALVVMAGTTTHLLQDTIGSGTGLMWAWPVSKRMGGFGTLNVKGGRAWLEVYANHPIAWVERLIILAALLLFLVNLLKDKR
jgi:membrane-bound metal-dependent hydrolase YbcI (DUF457 family)